MISSLISLDYFWKLYCMSAKSVFISPDFNTINRKRFISVVGFSHLSLWLEQLSVICGEESNIYTFIVM